MNQKLRPTRQEVQKALKVINSIAIMACLHGIETEPVPELIKTVTWLQEEFNISDRSL